ncbi:MAG: helix-hairpin-helix domain-containing protein [Candidatus Micrarchaeaceae archaeon]
MTNFDEIKFLPPSKIFSYYRQDIKGAEPIEVLVDTHEPEEIFKALEGYGFAPKRKTLDVGDYVFEGGIAFERKSGDFINFGDVILKAQELKSTYPFAYLVVESNLGALLKSKNRYSHMNSSTTNFEQLFGTVAALAAFGVPPLFCQNQYFLVKIMATIVKKLLDTKDRELGKIDGIRYATDKDYIFGMYLNLPGVGRKLAENIMKVYPTIESLMSASKEDFEKIDKIGPGKAAKIYNLLHKK